MAPAVPGPFPTSTIKLFLQPGSAISGGGRPRHSL